MNPRVVILGGGIAGLLAAYAFRKLKPTILEASGHLGGMYTAGGLKYIHDTIDTRALLGELGLTYTKYKPQGRLLQDGILYGHPQHLAQNTLQRHQIQLQHWAKTRGAEMGFRSDCMNDPLGDHGALKCDHHELLRLLAAKVVDSGCEVRLGARVRGLVQSHPMMNGVPAVEVQEGAAPPVAFSYDILIPTLPLPMLATLAPWADLPRAVATKLAIFQIQLPIYQQSMALEWDYIYTPDLRWITRISSPGFGGPLSVEVPNYFLESEGKTVDTAAPEVCAILKSAMGIDGTSIDAKTIPGHLRPLDKELVWPDGWYPLGRFAEWNSRATADKVYARALALASRHIR